MKTLSACFSLSRRWQLLVLIMSLTVTVSAADTRAWILLMQNPATAETIVSTDVNEKDKLVQAGWKLSGTGLLATEAGPDMGMLYRMLRATPPVGRRLAVTPEQVAANLEDGFVTEGALGYVVLKTAPDLVAVHCFRKGDRLIWVSGNDEQYWAEKNRWKREGAIFWLRPVPVS